MRGIALDYVNSQPWAILPEWLDAVQAVAARVDLQPELVAARTGKPLDNAKKVRMRDGVAVIPVRGAIMRYGNMFSSLCDSGATSIETLSTDFTEALENPTVKAILFDIDSPGGQAAGVGEFAERIFSARGQKPIRAYIGNYGCSAAYWIAAACDKIDISPTAMPGSIGVLMTVDTRKRPDEETIRSTQSPNKAPSPSTKEGRAELQRQVNAIADVFISSVARFRGISSEDVIEKYGAGGVEIGQAAVDAGMADSIGSLESCIADLAKPPESTMKGLLVSANANLDMTGASAGDSQRKADMTLKDRFLGWLDAGAPEVKTGEGVTSPEVAASVAADAERKALDKANERLAAGFTAQANAYFETLGDKVIPAEKAGLVDAYVALALADASVPLATPRLDSLKAAYGGRSSHGLLTEKISQDATEAAAKIAALGKVLPNAASVAKDNEEVKAAETLKRILQASPEGLAALKNMATR